MAFWNHELEPKRKFRWLITIPTMADLQFFAKTVTRPSWTLGNHAHKFLNHTFNYPARVEWGPVDMTFVDNVDPDISAGFLHGLRVSGYNFPDTAAQASQTVTKKKATEALGSIIIKQIGEDDTKVLDSWELKNAWASEVTIGDLSYEDDGMAEVSVKFIYDYAFMLNSGGKFGLSGAKHTVALVD